MNRLLFTMCLVLAGISHALVCPTNIKFEENDSLSRWVAHTINFKAKSCPKISEEIDAVHVYINISKNAKADTSKPTKGMSLEEYAILLDEYGNDTSSTKAFFKIKYPISEGKINGTALSAAYMWDRTIALTKTPFINGKREGVEYAYTFEDDKFIPFNEQTFMNDLLEGESIVYKDMLFGGKKVTDYSKGVIIRETQYFPNGEKRYEMPYNNGKRHGKYYQYTEDGRLSVVQEFVNDKRHGKAIHYVLEYEDGTEEQIWKNDKLTQIYNYYPNGQLRYSQEYPRGKYKEYYRSGELKISSTYKDSIMHGSLMDYTHTFMDGKCTEYYSSENIKVETNYRKGLKHGKLVEYYPCYTKKCKQQKSTEEHYKEGERHGMFIEYDIHGNIVSKAKYENNELVGVKVCSDGRQGNHKLNCRSDDSED